MSSELNIFSVYVELGFSSVGLVLLILLAVSFSCYVKIATVLAILRVGLGVNSILSAFVTGIVALALSFLVMFPTLRLAAIESGSVLSASQGAEASDKEKFQAFVASIEVWKDFLKKHSGERELERFSKISSKQNSSEQLETMETSSANYLSVLAPAFLVSELKRAFATGLALLLPLLLIELLVAHLLIALGINNINASVVALPFKLLLFVMLDGWALITTNLLANYS